MNTEAVLSELELATWEFAEAEAHERMAKALRIKAGKRFAAAHLELKSAHEAVLKSRPKKEPS